VTRRSANKVYSYIKKHPIIAKLIKQGVKIGIPERKTLGYRRGLVKKNQKSTNRGKHQALVKMETMRKLNGAVPVLKKR